MKKVNCILVYDQTMEHILMCKRQKDPYKGKLNLVGGKVEVQEDSKKAAYRELEEETGIGRQDIVLSHLVDFSYPMIDLELEVYVGMLEKAVLLKEEVNPLYWILVTEDFCDESQFAGEGNIHHMLAKAKLYEQYWKNREKEE